MFAGLDAVVYDVQDLGNRSYTFISTLGYVMDEAAKDNVEVIVLDRPNPLGGVRIEGPRLDSSVSSFVGLYDIPYVYGLTPAELALWINAHYLSKPCHLTIVSMRGWTRTMVWEDTGLRWIATSPNIPTAAAMRGYTATGCLGEIGIESGCGGPHPFEVVLGSGWDAYAVTRRFNALHVPGVRAEAVALGARHGHVSHDRSAQRRNLTAINFQVIDILQNEVNHFSAFGGTRGEQQDMFDKVCGTRSIRHRLQAGRLGEQHHQFVEFRRGALGGGAQAVPALREFRAARGQEAERDCGYGADAVKAALHYHYPNSVVAALRTGAGPAPATF